MVVLVVVQIQGVAGVIVRGRRSEGAGDGVSLSSGTTGYKFL